MATFGSLFAGIGGMDLGLERAGWDCRWQVEIKPYQRAVLARHWPDVPRFSDVKDIDGDELERVDLICGGFPCQDISSAGLKVGIGGERSGLWGEMARLVRVLRPRYVLVENVGDLVVRGLDVVLGDLHQLGFDAEWSTLPACAVGAPHTRRRLFVLAYAAGDDEPGQGTHHPLSDRGQADWSREPRGSRRADGRGPRWLPEPAVGRVADGVPWRMVRPPLSALGNAVVPQVAEWIGRQLLEYVRTEAA